MNEEERKLYNELIKLSKTANQRLLSIERYTGQKGLFGAKNLYDYLEVVNALTKSGRISTAKGLSETQLIGAIRATKEFLESETSTIKGIKKFRSKYEKITSKSLNFEQLETLYRMKTDYTFIYEYMTESEFWTYVNKEVKPNNYTKEQFVDGIYNMIDKIPDKEFTKKLENLYYYVMED